MRRLGYAYNLQESERGVNAVGACVRDGMGHALAAAVVAPASRCPRSRPAEITSTLMAVVGQIGREL